MVEISMSGSGEGPGWATGRGYSTVVFIPKYRRKVLYGQIREELKGVFRKLALQKESEIEAGHLAPDHVHMMIAIPPKYSVSQVVASADTQKRPP